jgi:alpha-glucosidase
MLAGPLDYTPGSMRNVHQSQFSPTATGIPKTMGSRVHEMAMYVMFDQPLGYFCDSPTEYRKFNDVMSFIAKVPTSWDQTLPLSGSVGEYAVVARKKGDDWWVGAMTNVDARDAEIDFSFLPDGEVRGAEVFRDTEITATNAKAYDREVVFVNNQSKLTFNLATEGGLAIRISESITSVDGTEKETGITISQDPNGDFLTVRSVARMESIVIHDISGKVVYHDEPIGNLSEVRVSTSSLRKGLYIVSVTAVNARRSAKFLKQ